MMSQSEACIIEISLVGDVVTAVGPSKRREKVKLTRPEQFKFDASNPHTSGVIFLKSIYSNKKRET